MKFCERCGGDIEWRAGSTNHRCSCDFSNSVSSTDRRFHWTVVNLRTGATCGYHATHHRPVNAAHVMGSPRVKEWAAGAPIKICDPGQILQDETLPCSQHLAEGSNLESSGAWNRFALLDHPEFEQSIHAHGCAMETQRDQLRHAIRTLRDAKGRHHTRLAYEKLMTLLPEYEEPVEPTPT